MADVTLPPVLIDPSKFSRQSASEINPMMFLKGTDLYLILVGNDFVTMGAFKGSLLPTTSGDFTLKDSAGAPTVDAEFACASRDGEASIGVVYLQVGTGLLSFVEFATAPADTWGVSSVSVLTANPFGFWTLVKRSDGAYRCTFADGGTNQLYYVPISAGAWGVPVLLNAANTVLYQSVIDSSDTVHSIFRSGGRLYYQQVSSTGTVSAAQDLGAAASINNANLVVFGSSICILYAQNSGVTFIAGTPLAAPVFGAPVAIESGGGADQFGYPCAAPDGSGNLTSFWTYVNNGGGAPGVDQIHFSTSLDGGVTWPASSIFYDAVANPPVNGRTYPDQFLHTAQALFYAGAGSGPGGNWLFPTAMETLDASIAHCTGFMLIGGEALAALALTCPVGAGTATVGVPYSATLAATGGTPPYTYAIISGSLPSGLSLNASTGVISGTPTLSATFSYTAQATDSLGATASVSAPCTISVAPAGGGGGVCVVVPTPASSSTLQGINEPVELTGS